MKLKSLLAILLSAVMLASCTSVNSSTADSSTETSSVSESYNSDISSTETSSEDEKISESSESGSSSSDPVPDSVPDSISNPDSEPDSNPDPEPDDSSESEEIIAGHKSKLSGADYTKLKNEYVSVSHPNPEKSGCFSTDSKYIWTFYHMSDYGVVGCGDDNVSNYTNELQENTLSNESNNAYIEMYFGLKAEIKNNILTMKTYDNTGKAKVRNLSILDCNKNVIDSANKNTLTADLTDDEYINGFYALKSTFSYKNRTCIAYLYLWVNCKSDNPRDYEFYICYGNSCTYIPYTSTKYVTDLNELIENAGIKDPYKDAISSDVRYPNEATNMNGGKFDTDFWIKKSYEILESYENAAPSFKATLLHDWMTRNLIYDEYKVQVLHESRYYNDYVSGKYYVSKINIGVCRDFANIYLIMCREQGIPCVMCSPSARNHVWNAIYVDGRWYEVDLTDDITRYAYEADINDVTPLTEDNEISYKKFCRWDYPGKLPAEINAFLHMM